MLRRLVLVLMLLAGLAAAPLARASQPCCDHGCDAMPACVSVCAVCAIPALLPAPQPAPVGTAPQRLEPAAIATAFDDWTAEIWNPPD